MAKMCEVTETFCPDRKCSNQQCALILCERLPEVIPQHLRQVKVRAPTAPLQKMEF